MSAPGRTIPAADPYQLAELFEDAYTARDVGGFVGLFEPQAAVATDDAATMGRGASGGGSPRCGATTWPMSAR